MSCSETPCYLTATVTKTAEVQASIFYVQVSCPANFAKTVLPGQFFMLQAVPSKTLLTRPISVYHTEASQQGTVQSISFLILKKGQGTEELCTLKAGDSLKLLGPLGNTFPTPSQEDFPCIVGGGIGVAPVAGFASTLPEKSYDFIASFRTGSYGLDNIVPKQLTITTNDGSQGVPGMLPDVLTCQTIKEKGYTCLYACGPEPMLAYVQKVCKEAGIPSYLSMESAMACGMGACLGCTITTKEGNKRCCKEGPVFPGEILIFPEKNPHSRSSIPLSPLSKEETPDLSLTIAGVRFSNPVIAASGTFGYGTEYASVTAVQKLGGICSKGLTLEPRPGNQGVRLKETPSGLINSIGLENPGIPHFIEKELPTMLSLGPVTIANLSGSSIETYTQGAALLEKTAVPMIELNISCPNVKAGGMAFGLHCEDAAMVTSAVKKAAPSKPLIVKLSPNAPDLIAVAEAVRKAGADALSLINTVQAISINIEKGKPLFNNIRAGLSGPAVKPLALRLVYDLIQHMNTLPESQRIPVIALGGIATWKDAVEFIMAGAHAIQVGTATFANPTAMTEIILGLEEFMKRKGFRSLEDFRGCAQI
ncbi:MAG: dihydroorotate dehydrogenase [Candidatus Treponema excrementipullorum]|nr:dihydroorotate dehydrogenase [Candidatus Treponema excrementipullorum]